MSKEQTLKALSLLQLAYANALDKDRLRLYIELLQDIEPNLLASAVRYCINHNKFLPTVAEIREVVEKAVELESGTVVSAAAAEAWKEVNRAIKSVGMYGSPVFSTVEIQKTVERLDWQDLCTTATKDINIVRAQFRNAYNEEISQKKELLAYKRAGFKINEKYIAQIDAETKRITDKMSLRKKANRLSMTEHQYLEYKANSRTRNEHYFDDDLIADADYTARYCTESEKEIAKKYEQEFMKKRSENEQ